MQLGTSLSKPADERLEYGARAIGGRETFAVFFFVKCYTELFEKRDGARRRKRAQHVTNDAPIAAPEVVLGDDAVRYVAARAAADENLRADLLRAVDTDNARARHRPRAEQRSCEPRRTPTHH